MYAAERQQRILTVARAAGRVEVLSLADDLAVSPETIRRDLTNLERVGALRRVHGGAIPVERLGFGPSVATRAERFVAEKERIAKLALDLVPEEGTLLLDAGTTTLRLAEALPRDRELTVVTNSLPIAAAVSSNPAIQLYLLGGRFRSRTQAAVGEWSQNMLAELTVDVAFLGTNGVSLARGLTTPDPSEALSKRAMVAAARRCVLLADSSKVGAEHFCRFATLDDIAVVVTDTGLDEDTATDIESLGPEVIRA
ncbi:MAG TPA: DeoR/GlpR family DNA-binding transcription regulator [Dermatophilaceae bacterium]|nr:DeoR/GlpR family DNA-binding transcription regulator [Dermatophilaceae bacterium]